MWCSDDPRRLTLPRRAHAGRRAALGALLLAGGAGSLAGCGFRLRGVRQLPFTTLYAGFAPSSQVGNEFRRQIERVSGTRLTVSPQTAEAQLDVLADSLTTHILTYSAVGRVRQFEMQLTLVYQVRKARGKLLAPPATITVRRELSAADNQQTTRPDEGGLIGADMARDIVQQLLRRLEHLPAGG